MFYRYCLLLTAFLTFLVLNGLLNQTLCAQNTPNNTELPYNIADPNLPDWVQLMYTQNPDPGQVIAAYTKYYKTNKFVKNGHTQYYKRWLRGITRKLGATNNNNLPANEAAVKAYKKNEAKYIANSLALQQTKDPTSPWTSLGPIDFDKEAADRSYAAGAAHVYCIDQSTSNPDILYAATATTGIWKTTDHGLNWVATTHNLMINSLRALKIHPSDANIVYAGMMGSLYITNNGGLTWNNTPDANFTALTHDISDIITHPTNGNLVWLASDQGLYYSSNGGVNWQQLLTGIFQEIEIKPDNPDIMYAVKQINNRTEFYKSEDGGINFIKKGIGWPDPSGIPGTPEQKRTEIATTPANPNLIYAFATGVANGGSGLYGIYRSTDAGENWAFMCCGEGPGGVPNEDDNKNLCAWSDEGEDDGGQYYYDLALDVSSKDGSKLFAGAVNLWISTDSGNDFTCPSKWSHSEKPNYVHADIHDIKYDNDEIWIACDGGIFYSNDDGKNFQRRMLGITGTDFWGFAAGFLDGNVMLGGVYHNGTLLKDNDTFINGWISTDGGDGIRGYTNYGYPRLAFSDYNRKLLSGNREVKSIKTNYTPYPNASYIVGESSDMAVHPFNYNIYYAGEDTKLRITYDGGYTAQDVYDFGAKVAAVEIARTDPNVLYVCTYPGWWDTKRIYRSDDAGKTFTEITPASTILNGETWMAYDIAVSSTNAKKIWMVRTSPYGGGYPAVDGFRAYTSDDGGQTWQNYTTPELNGEGITNIIHLRGTNGGVYIGTDRAVYYRNDNMPNWALFNNQLPLSTYSVRLVPWYRGGKLRDGTNRSVYEADFYEQPAPQAQIATDRQVVYCERDSVQFINYSGQSAKDATWYWEFEGGNPATSTAENPKVAYPTPGVYDVKLTVTDAFGTSTQTLKNLITTFSGCAPEPIPGNALKLNGNGDYASTQPLNLNTNNLTLSAWIKPEGQQLDWAGILFCRGGNTTSGISLRDDNELRFHWNEGFWDVGTGLYLPDGYWSHVAMVVQPKKITLYVNGNSWSLNDTFDPQGFNAPLDIGLDNCCERYFKGSIDEVKVWNKALTKQEIRAAMHPTSQNDAANLVAYYQFNETQGPILDKIGSAHAGISGNGQRVTSSAPVGGGLSGEAVEKIGGVDFLGTQFSANYTEQGGATSVVSNLNLLPYNTNSIAKNEQIMGNEYWVLNRWGSGSFKADYTFKPGFDITPTDAANPNLLKMYARAFNGEGPWGPMGKATAADAQTNTVTFNNLSIQGQLIVTASPCYATGPNTVKLKTWLQGAYNEGTNLMNTNLYDAGLLPKLQPYQSAPFNFSGWQYADIIPADVVDWVMVEAREADNIHQIAETTTGFLRNDGQIIGINGAEGISFRCLDVNKTYYFAVYHRNHLPIISAMPLSIDNTTPHDLSVPTNVLHGATQLVKIGNSNVYAMPPGNADGNGAITVLDFNNWLLDDGNPNLGYYNADFNFDGLVNDADFSLLQQNPSAVSVWYLWK